MESAFDRLARSLIDTGAATTARLLRTGRHATATGPAVSLPRSIAGAGGAGGVDEDAEPAMTNPMTAPGSLVIGGESGAGEELLPGAEGDVLAMIDGAPAWVARPGGRTWSVLTNGNPADPQLVWTDQGDVIMVEGG